MPVPSGRVKPRLKATAAAEHFASKSVDVALSQMEISPLVNFTLESLSRIVNVQFGLDIKKGSQFPFTFPVELANGCVGYVPTEDAFGPHGGGYETRLTSYSNLEITAGRQIANAGIELANQMTPGPVPQPPPAPAFGAPWTYGNVPPELE